MAVLDVLSPEVKEQISLEVKEIVAEVVEQVVSERNTNLLKAKDVMAKLNISADTFIKIRAQGLIKGQPLKGTSLVRYPASEIEEYIRKSGE
ncbi:helix-turn-helix transcriptional regulator [Liquorilactobacillus hordei]|uniref:helix-turn-helix transcriptional regulator n=1 Tax=Liquorilactobacillus hordei TaxID=468911 RepID=UPI0039ED7A50